MVILKLLTILLLILIPGGIPILLTLYWRNRNAKETERDEERSWPFGDGTHNFYDSSEFPSRESTRMVANADDNVNNVPNDMVFRQTYKKMDE